jgi:hypothetical protein
MHHRGKKMVDVKEAKQILEKSKTQKDMFNWCEDYKDFVSTNIYACVTSEWDYMLKRSYEDSESPCSYQDFPSTYFDEYEMIEAIKEKLKEDDLDKTEEFDFISTYIDVDGEKLTKKEYVLFEQYLKDCDSEQLRDMIEKEPFLNDLDVYDYEHENEIYEWWLCSDYLRGLMSDEVFCNGAWGRQSTGQHMSLDYAMMEAYKKSLRDYIALIEGVQK